MSSNEYWEFVDNIQLRVINKKIQFQNGLCTYKDLKYLLENLLFIKNTANQLNCLIKILSTCLITLSYTLYTSFIAYLIITQLKTIFNNTNQSSTSTLIQERILTSQSIIIENLFQKDEPSNLSIFNNRKFLVLNKVDHNFTNNWKNKSVYSTCKTQQNFNNYYKHPNLILIFERK